eukprot:2966489-Amphidinium_carterae.1
MPSKRCAGRQCTSQSVEAARMHFVEAKDESEIAQKLMAREPMRRNYSQSLFDAVEEVLPACFPCHLSHERFFLGGHDRVHSAFSAGGRRRGS